MELQHINVKLIVSDPAAVDLERLVPIFHGWIQEQSREELLLDVADYRHVPGGPGVILIGHEANYSVDDTNHRLGVRYNRKAAVAGTNQGRLAQAARAALAACQALETDPSLDGKLRFNGQEIEISMNDRLIAPNNAATRQALEPEFSAFFRKLFAGSVHGLAFDNGDARRLFGVLARSSRIFTTGELLKNLNA
ncbi:MAG: hypothetical protein HY508_13095 [Acidobacteria bacterium]|nr:hypothetical protein [Acidobacteriota bacterium]